MRFGLLAIILLVFSLFSSCTGASTSVPPEGPLQLRDTLTLTSTTTATDIPVPTATGMERFIADVNQNGSECYNGPAENYPEAAVLHGGHQVEVLGKSELGDWFLVQGSARCWMRANTLIPRFDPGLLLILYTVYTNKDSVCRTGPSTVYKEQTYISKGRRIVLNGKNGEDADWALITPTDSTKQCWIASTLLSSTNFFSAPVDFSAIPIVDTPEPPTIVPATPTRRSGGPPNETPGGSDTTSTPGGGTTPNPTNTPKPQPTATLCWPPGKCK